MRSTAAAVAALAFAAPASALTVDWARALSAIPAEMYNNATIPVAATASGKITKCSKAGAHATSFTPTISPIAPSANDLVTTTFDYVRAGGALLLNLCAELRTAL